MCQSALKINSWRDEKKWKKNNEKNNHIKNGTKKLKNNFLVPSTDPNGVFASSRPTITSQMMNNKDTK